jgi:RND superfamily putative drug exporter
VISLLFDTLIVRSFMTPSIATILGPWFWWPGKVRIHPPRPWPAPTRKPLTVGAPECAESE